MYAGRRITLRFVFYHHEQHGPFRLEDLYTGQVQYAGTVARLRLLFWLARRGMEVYLIGNVEDGDYRGVKASAGTGKLAEFLGDCSRDNPVLLILNHYPDSAIWSHIQKIKQPGLFLILWASGPFAVDWMRQVAVGKLDRIVCISQAQRDIYRVYSGFDKLEMAYLGVDLDFLQPVSSRQNTSCLVLSTSIPRRTKGFHSLLQAWKLVRQSVPDAQLRVCGSARMHDPHAVIGCTGILDAELEEEFPEFFGDYPSSSQAAGIELMGARALPDVYTDLHNAQVAVVNSIWNGSLEMFCRSAVEAQMSGVPVVGAARGSLPEVVAHGRTGLLITRKDPAALADAIITLLKDDKLRERMGVAGPAWALPMADYGLIAPEWESIAQRVLSGEPAPSPKQPIQDVLRKMGYGQIRLWLRDRLK